MDNKQKKIVQTLYDYLNNKMTNETFDTEIKKLFEEVKKNNKNNPVWINTIQRSFNSIDDDPVAQEELGCLSRDAFKYDILQILRNLQIRGEYKDIIKTNYMSFI